MNKTYIVSDAFNAEELLTSLHAELANSSDFKLELEKQPTNVMSAEPYMVTAVVSIITAIGGYKFFVPFINGIFAVYQKKLDNKAKQDEYQYNLDMLKMKNEQELTLLKENHQNHLAALKQENDNKMANTMIRIKTKDTITDLLYGMEQDKLLEIGKSLENGTVKSIALITNP